MFEKEFDKWNENKKIVNGVKFIEFIHPREIWWCALGVNIGSEQDGIGENFERPVVVLCKLSPKTCLCVPLSTKEKLEKFQSPINSESTQGFALLDQVRVIDTKRLKRKVGIANIAEFEYLVRKLKDLF